MRSTRIPPKILSSSWLPVVRCTISDLCNMTWEALVNPMNTRVDAAFSAILAGWNFSSEFQPAEIWEFGNLGICNQYTQQKQELSMFQKPLNATLPNISTKQECGFSILPCQQQVFLIFWGACCAQRPHLTPSSSKVSSLKSQSCFSASSLPALQYPTWSVFFFWFFFWNGT